jgi:hypothetical protein
MQYRITRRTLDCRDSIDTTSDQFDAAKLAKERLIEALGVEEKFNLLLENYAEFETALLGISLRRTIFMGQDWSESQNDIHTVNRRIVNLLTTSRLYLDQISHNMNSMYGAGALASLKKALSDEYDSSLGFRALEALRNYVQHRDLPVRRLIYGASREANMSQSKRTLTPSLSIERLKQEGKFKASILKELVATGGEFIDLKPIIREAMESYGRVQAFVRQLIATDIAQSDSIVLGIKESFQAQFGPNVTGLAVVSANDKGKTVEYVQIFDELIQRRNWLETRNPALTRYNAEVISSERTE